MKIVLGMLILLWPLLVVLTVLTSLGWFVLAGLAGLLWVGQRLLRAAVEMDREAWPHHEGR